MKYYEAIRKYSSQVQKFIHETAEESNQPRRSLSNFNNRLINEGLITIYRVCTNLNLTPTDKILLEKAYRVGQECVYSRLIYFGNFLRLSRSDQSFLAANASISTMYSSLLGAHLGVGTFDSSTDEYFLSRMPRLFETIAPSKNPIAHSPILYLLFNLGQALAEYVISYSDDKAATDLLEKLHRIQNEYLKHLPIQNYLRSKPQLELFYKSQWNLATEALKTSKEKKTAHLQTLPALKIEYQLRILSALAALNASNFVTLFESNFDLLIKSVDSSQQILPSILLLRCISEYYAICDNKNVIDLELLEIANSKKLPDDYLSHIFSKYNEAMILNIDKKDMDILLSYSDSDLRKRLANVILHTDRNDLLRERQKPHGVFEVSDMDVRIKLSGESYLLCMPFKSALEIKSKTIPESIAYQIFRPFIHFQKAIVVFITAKRCSQSLMEYIKKIQNRLGWNLSVIENEELAKLLKINNELH